MKLKKPNNFQKIKKTGGKLRKMKKKNDEKFSLYSN